MKKKITRLCDEDSADNITYEPNSTYYDLNKRVFYLHGEVTDKLSIIFARALNEFYKIGKTPVTIDINSTGGSLDTAISIISNIKNSKLTFDTFVSGSAFSAGAFILLAGEKRRMSPISTLMFHYPIYDMKDSSDKMLSIAQTTTEVYIRIMKYLLKGTKLKIPMLLKQIENKEWYVSPIKAKELGLVHEITR